MERIIAQPLGSRIQKYKIKQLCQQEKLLKDYSVTETATAQAAIYSSKKKQQLLKGHKKHHSTTATIPLFKHLLSSEFYAMLDEQTDRLPRQEIALQSRKIDLKARKQASQMTQQNKVGEEQQWVSYVDQDLDPKNNDHPLYQFMTKAAKSSKIGVQQRVKDAAKQHTILQKKLGRRYNKLLKQRLKDHSPKDPVLQAVIDADLLKQSQSDISEQENDNQSSEQSESDSQFTSSAEYDENNKKRPKRQTLPPTSSQDANQSQFNQRQKTDFSEDPDEWKVYNKSFSTGTDRQTQIGPSFQVTETAIPPMPSMIKSQANDQQLMQSIKKIDSKQVWDPNRLSSETLDFFFANVKLFWPYDLYKYSEDLALTYLMRKNYDIELALALIIVDLDDLVELMRKQDKRLDQNLQNYDFSGSQIHHAHSSVRHNQAIPESTNLG